MKAFADLYARLDRSTGTLDKRRALVDYFGHAAPADAAWAVWVLTGNKVGGAGRKLAASGELRQWISEVSQTEDWLVDACYHHVGDLAETLALLLDDPPQPPPALSLSAWVEQRLLPVANAPEPQRRAVITDAWQRLPFAQRLVFNKLLTGALRVGVSQGLVQQALSQVSGVEVPRIAQRLMGKWQPSAAFMQRLFSAQTQDEDASLPMPFFLASPLEADAQSLGAFDEWLVEYKWDGIRLQLIKRGDVIALWSRGEERLDGRFPELEAAASSLPRDAALDGELLAWLPDADAPLPFSALQTRIQRRKPSATVLANTPVRMLAYDLLELDGQDIRQQPLQQRRALLQGLLDDHGDGRIQLSPQAEAHDWASAAQLREQARDRGVEGLMLKRRDSPYQHGRKRGDWWKWKVAPLTIDAVMLYAQAGHGRRSTLYTDYTFGVWDGDRLVPVAKAYSGLTDAEILALDKWIRANTRERFGPVRSVAPEQVFELAFEGVNISKRHKSGVAVRFPRIVRWRQDKPAAEADVLATLQAQAQ